MKIKLKSRMPYQQIHYLLLAAAIPIFLLLLFSYCQNVLPFGDRSIVSSDAFHQYEPFLCELQRRIHNKESLLYNLRLGMGINFWGIITYYLMSPLYLIPVSAPFLPCFFVLTIYAKISLASMSFAYCTAQIYNKKTYFFSILGAFYGLCAWTIGFHMLATWLDAFALFPLIVLGAYQLLTEGKEKLFVLSLALCAIVNYYICFSICLFILIFFISYHVAMRSSRTALWHSFRQFAIWSVLAIALSACITLPAFSSLRESAALNSNAALHFSLISAEGNTFSDFIELIRQTAGNIFVGVPPTRLNGYANIYCGALSVALAACYLIATETPRRIKIVNIGVVSLLAISMLFDPLNFIWHGFHYPNSFPNRFSFIFCFCILMNAAAFWLIADRVGDTQMLIPPFVLLAALFLTKRNDANNYPLCFPANLILITAFIVFIFISFWSWRKHNRKAKIICCEKQSDLILHIPQMPEERTLVTSEKFPHTLAEYRKQNWKKHIKSRKSVVCILLCAELLFHFFFVCIYFGVNKNYPQYQKELTDSKALLTHQTSDFSRTEDVTQTNYNASMAAGYSGISYFSSISKYHVGDFLGNLGLAGNGTTNNLQYTENTPVANLFLNLQYLICYTQTPPNQHFWEIVKSEDQKTIYENLYTIPFGCTVSSNIKNISDNSTEDPFQFQQKLFSAATGISDPLWSEKMLTFSRLKDAENRINRCAYTYTVEKDVETLYVYLYYLNRELYDIYVNGKQIYQNYTTTQPSLIYPHIKAISNLQEGDTIQIIFSSTKEMEGFLSTSAAGNITTPKIKAVTMDNSVFEKGYEKLCENQFCPKQITDTYIDGTISANNDCMLYLPISHDSNWQVSVDGKPIQSESLAGAMFLVPVGKGTHRIKLTYKNNALFVGFGISGGTILFLTGKWFIDSHRRKNKTKQK